MSVYITCDFCHRLMTRCICEDADARIETLRASNGIDVDVIRAFRFLGKFDIERERAAQAKKGQP